MKTNRHPNNIFAEIQTVHTDTTAMAAEWYQHATNCGHRMSTKLEENRQVPARAKQGRIL